ncbi:MAG: hypothetical protein ACE5KH_00055 [Candidatus Geothermarchaeales archaeon]
MHPLISGLMLVAIAAPSQLLLLELFGKIRAPVSIKKLGVPALVLFLTLLGYSYVYENHFFGLVGWGLVAGLLATVALDSIRIPGWLVGWMPLDLPIRFGTMALDLDDGLKMKMMSRVMKYSLGEMKKGRDIIPEGSTIPRLSVSEVRTMIEPALGDTLRESGVSKLKTRIVGYLWHYSNGASFGAAHVLLFGRGDAFYTFGFSMLLATVFLLILSRLIPVMRPGIKLPAVVILAHVNVSWVLALIAFTFVGPEMEAFSLLDMLASGIHL